MLSKHRPLDSCQYNKTRSRSLSRCLAHHDHHKCRSLLHFCNSIEKRFRGFESIDQNANPSFSYPIDKKPDVRLGVRFFAGWVPDSKHFREAEWWFVAAKRSLSRSAAKASTLLHGHRSVLSPSRFPSERLPTFRKKRSPARGRRLVRHEADCTRGRGIV